MKVTSIWILQKARFVKIEELKAIELGYEGDA